MARRRRTETVWDNKNIALLIGLGGGLVVYFWLKSINTQLAFNQNFPGAALNDPAMQDPYLLNQ